MALNFFLIYIGCFLAGSIAMVVAVKSFAEGFSTGGKRPVLTGSFSAVMVSGAAFLSTYVGKNLYTVFWVLAGIFLLFGVIHVNFFHRKYFHAKKYNRVKVIIGELLFCAALVFFTIVVFSSLEYFLQNKSFLFYPMLLSILAFFIPVALLYTFEAAYNIPEPLFNAWTYPVNEPIDLPDEQPGERLLVIAFEIAKKHGSDLKTNFRAKGPENMKLGDLYYHFINDYNELNSETTIEYLDARREPDQWWFRVKRKWYQPQQVLNPQVSMRDNRVRENSIIICERITATNN